MIKAFLDALSVYLRARKKTRRWCCYYRRWRRYPGVNDRLSPSVLSEVKRLGVPIHTVVIDDGVPFKDIAIEDVAMNCFRSNR